MTDDGRFLSIKDFRENATEEDYAAMWNYLQEKGEAGFKSQDNPEPAGPYLFSASAARQELKKWQEQRKAAQEQQAATELEQRQATAPVKEESELKIRYGKKGFSKRSVLIANDNWDLLQEVCGKYEGANKHYVLDALLSEILTKYR